MPRFPFVLANAQHPGNGEPFRPRHVILERKVEDLDGAPHPAHRRDRNRAAAGREMEQRVLNGALIFGDAVAAVAREAALLKAAGADIVVALAHSRLGRHCPGRRRGTGDTPRDTLSPKTRAGHRGPARTSISSSPAIPTRSSHRARLRHRTAGNTDRAAGFLGLAPGLHRHRPDETPRRGGRLLEILKAQAEALPSNGAAQKTGRVAAERVPPRQTGLRRTIGASTAPPGPCHSAAGSAAARCRFTPISAPSRPAPRRS
jgi:hypothetical protein